MLNAVFIEHVCHPRNHAIVRSMVIRLVMSVCVRTVYVLPKNRLFSALLLANILLSVICCLLLELNTSSVVCYVQQAVQAEQFMLF